MLKSPFPAYFCNFWGTEAFLAVPLPLGTTGLATSTYNISYTYRGEEHLCTNVYQRMVDFMTPADLQTLKSKCSLRKGGDSSESCSVERAFGSTACVMDSLPN